jgi:glycosyltransferase involved in cell wall biosynthesis
MHKKTILHFIYSLGRGGAETMLVRVIKELPEYHNIVVTLKEDNHFESELQCDEYICLHKPSLLSLAAASVQLKKIIQQHKVDLVHSHLPQSNFIARLATPKKVPLVTTIHTSIATASDYKKWYIRWLDKLTFHYRSSVIIAVSGIALKDYFSVLQLKGQQSHVLYTFVDVAPYIMRQPQIHSKTFRIISIGALRKGKNYPYLIEAFKKIREEAIELHIYGAGPEKEALQLAIEGSAVKIILMGQVNQIHEILPQYDLFVMSSRFEGFSLSVLEAMAAGLPLLLSDIPSFREQCGNTALYFDLHNPGDFLKTLNVLLSEENTRKTLAHSSHLRVMENFTLPHHVTQLREIYKDVMRGDINR